VNVEPAKTDPAPTELDEATKKVIENFDAHARARATELLKHPSGEGRDPLLRIAESAFCLGYKTGVIDAGQAIRPQIVTSPAPILLSAELAEARRRADDEFSRYFMERGYVVAWDGKCGTSDHWYEIREGTTIVCQVQGSVPLAEFLTDLPHLVEGKPGVGPTDYWCACEDAAKLRALLERVRAAETGERP